MMTDDALAKLRRGEPVDVNPVDDTPIEPTVSLLAELVVQATRIANNTGKPDIRFNRVDVERAWDSTGMRLHGDVFQEALKALGIKVDE